MRHVIPAVRPAILLAILLVTAGVAVAATIDVACDPAALVAAVEAAEMDADADVLELAPGCLYLFESAYGDTFRALPWIRRNLTIHGNGATIERSRAASVPKFGLLGLRGGPVRIHDLTLRGGWATRR